MPKETVSVKEFILGGARSGKSRLAEQRALESGLEVWYIATAQALDVEMQTRVRQHRQRRPSAWRVAEEPLALAECLHEHARPDRCLLVDCLTLWLANLLAEIDRRFIAERDAFLAALADLPGRTILVSNEVGQGIVPENALARRFRDEAGWLHQQVAQRCDRVEFVVAGLSMQLKNAPEDV